TEAGLIFVGPPAAAIRAMGDKTEARRRMQAAGVPVVPGTTTLLRDPIEARKEAKRLGYPVLLKAAAGGGGKGMRLVTRDAEVEHPITELVYGVDLVREQLRIAAGQPMRVHGATGPGGQLHPRGAAIECRITAEDPFNDFLPATGVLQYLRVPSGPGVRWDAGVEAGNDVTLFYDPLLAKLIAWGETREHAIQRMRRALSELVIVGL